VLVEVQSLTVRHGDGREALRDVSFQCARGLIGVLGRNGAGKSTLFRVLASQQSFTGGQVTVAGADVHADAARARAAVGYLPQDFGFPPALSARELVEHMAVLKGVGDTARARRAAAADMLERVGLTGDADRSVGALSGGMRQRVGLAMALLGMPPVLVVDEPTVALDPVERHRIHDLLATVAEHGVVLLSTHLVADVDAVCEHVLLLHAGRLVRNASPSALMAALDGRVWRARVPHADAATLRATRGVLRDRLVGGAVEVTVIADAPPNAEFYADAPTMEDVFAEATVA
jgi:ABC-2 type transport system ATP-binding protein